jgi:hypothetical protein
VGEDPVDDIALGGVDEAEDLHTAAAAGAGQGIDLPDAFDQPRPAAAGRAGVGRRSGIGRAGGGYMLVSATDGDHLSLNGGLEYIDLPTLASQGFVLAEIELAALGGFVITNPTGGYFLFHTDIVPSNHLHRFTIAGGAVPGPEIVFDFGVYLDALLFDPDTDVLYMPAAVGGIHVVDTNTNTPLTPQPIPLPGFPVDQVIGPVGSPYDLTGDGVVAVLDFLVLLTAWGDCASPCPPSCLADIATPDGPGSDCAVNILDVLLLLANWDA